MIDQLLSEIISRIWIVAAFVVVTVLFCAYIYKRTEVFKWDKRHVRAFAIMYDLDFRGMIGFTLLLARMFFIIYLSASGGSGIIGDIICIEMMTVAYIIMSGDIKEWTQIFVFLVIYVILFLENMFIDYNANVESGFLPRFLAISFGIFASLYNIQFSLSSYEKLLNICAERDKRRYREKIDEIRNNQRSEYTAGGTQTGETENPHGERSDGNQAAGI